MTEKQPEKYDLVIIGGGPGGYTAAAEVSARGLKTALVEDKWLGGTCLNRGCIPTKTLMHSSEIIRKVNAGVPGVIANSESDGAPVLGVDMKALNLRRQQVTDELTSGIAGMLKKASVEIYNGHAIICGPDSVKVMLNGGDSDCDVIQLEAERILIASGSRPVMPAIEGCELEGVMLSDEFIISETLPEKLIIIGGGVIGMEFATVYNGLGAEVTVLEGSDRLLSPLDREFSQSIKMVMKKRDVQIVTGALVNRIRKNTNGRLECVFTQKAEDSTAEADIILIAAGRAPVLDGLFEDGFSVKLSEGYIEVDEGFRTSCGSIYAIGDVTGGVQLAHAAQAQARNFAALISGAEIVQDINCVPGCVYTDPEIAYVGLSADEAKKKGIKTITKKYPMLANGKSVLSMQERGFIKIIASASDNVIIGAQMMCAHATDMIGEFAVAITNSLTIDDMKKAVHPHPTFSEGISEALML